jgi:competence protein ComEA
MKQRYLPIILLITLLLSIPVSSSFAGSKKSTNTGEHQSQVSERLDINKAEVEELSQLPGIGEKKAQMIVQYVEENGKFKSVDELVNVKGIGPKLLEKISPFITI